MSNKIDDMFVAYLDMNDVVVVAFRCRGVPVAC